MERLIEFLFLPWFWLDKTRHDWTASKSSFEILEIREFWQTLALGVAILLTFKLVRKVIKHPPFFEKAFLIFTILLFIGILGAGTNELAKIVNGGKMPVTATAEEIDDEHIVVDENTKFVFLSDWIEVKRYETARFLYPSDSHISPGDIMIAININFFWWTSLIFCMYAILHYLLTLYFLNKTPN